MRTRVLPIVVAFACLGMGACSSTGNGPDGPPARREARPSTDARITIVSPRNGQVVKGPEVAVRLALAGAKIVRATSKDISPERGHIHVYLDNSIVSMNYGLSETIATPRPGLHVLRAEFVASDHLPFDPRDFTEVTFQVSK